MQGFSRKILNDRHKYLIAMLQSVQNGYELPERITPEEYRYIRDHKDDDPALAGFVGFGCSFGGKWFGGYARNASGTNYALQSKRSLLKDMATLQDARFVCEDYRRVCIPPGAVIYADPPYQVGLTAPPFHPWCRCCTAPYFEDMEGLGERWTRNPDGTTTKVPANTTFAQWRQSFVQGPTPGLQVASGSGTMAAKATTHFQSVVQGLPASPNGYTDALEQHYASGNQTAQAVFERYVQPGSVADGAFSGTPHFDSRIQKVKMNFANDMTDPRGPATTFFHEHGHYIDFMSCAGSGYTSMQTPDFGDALKKDFEAYVKATMKAHGTKRKTDAYAIISQELRGALPNAISDLFGGMSRNKCAGTYGHWNTRYWTYSGMLEKEAFAHMFAAQFDADRYALMQKYFPTALAEFEKLLKGVTTP